ncbi:MAG: acyltransferase [Sulfuricurvum sp.]|uniref:acyltransferase n=1 Tax=Sulfuricurvum sp. TaxID=2025608 RepID=UPI00260C8616|nr:acyltransferase [Sulfuricurvum sp.]MDD2367679.1 acyltransferase [Sulfuricurvum sp.]MDD2950095.1 acyltransferase [Sulfuricurvum sp.]MDD5118604.1 acyltransferase [Sulfuricurvum sp.]
MKFFKLIFNKIYRKILESSFVHPNQYAKSRGVRFGSHCSFRTKQFGSEPYLIKMGDYVATSVDVSFVTHDGAVSVIRQYDEKYKKIDLIKPINIGNNVFIGWGAIIMPGTTIGDNVIVGAGSVVKGELTNNSIYAGVPAKYICSLSEYIEKNEPLFLQTKHLNIVEKKKFLVEHFTQQLQGNI